VGGGTTNEEVATEPILRRNFAAFLRMRLPLCGVQFFKPCALRRPPLGAPASAISVCHPGHGGGESSTGYEDHGKSG